MQGLFVLKRRLKEGLNSETQVLLSHSITWNSNKNSPLFLESSDHRRRPENCSFFIIPLFWSRSHLQATERIFARIPKWFEVFNTTDLCKPWGWGRYMAFTQEGHGARRGCSENLKTSNQLGILAKILSVACRWLLLQNKGIMKKIQFSGRLRWSDDSKNKGNFSLEFQVMLWDKRI